MTGKIKIPIALNEICSYLQSECVTLSKYFEDGRVNASLNEDEIIKVIRKRYDISVPKIRAWYDFAIEEKDSFIPVNIKVTDTTHADNLNCKLM
ncbi:MAG: hypothetical protein LBR17_01625 [Bacteroidales bacterium]|jgi:hypothetical protein|nr:hypothetical protein [Bacteroidales bacterium]